MKIKILAILITTFIVIGSFSAIGQKNNFSKKELQNLNPEKNSGIIIDDGIQHQINVDIGGELKESEDIELDIFIEGLETFDSISFKAKGDSEYLFTGFDLSNVNMDDPEIVQYELDDKIITRYVNAEEMYSLFVRLDEVVKDEDISKSNDKFSYIKTFFLGLIKDRAVLKSIFNLFENEKESELKNNAETGIKNPDLTIMLKEDGTGIIQGFITESGKEKEIISKFQTKEISQRKIANEISSKKLKAASKNLNVPYRWQFELLYETGDYSKAHMACGPASVAMVEEYYTGRHPSLKSIVNQYDCTNGWSSNTVEEYLESKIDLPFFNNRYLDSKSSCIDVLRYGCIKNDYPAILRIEVPDGHYVVIDGYQSDSFYINNPAYPWSGHLWYNDAPFWMPWDAYTFGGNAYVTYHVNGQYQKGIRYIV